MTKVYSELKIPQGAILTNVAVTFREMDECEASVTAKFDGRLAADFNSDWEIESRGHKFIMPLRKPQGSADNESMNSTLTLTFVHWAIYQLQRYLFFTVQPIETGTAVADKYDASVSLPLNEFIELFGLVLSHYYGDKITIMLNPEWVCDPEPATISIKNSSPWDVLKELYKSYGVRWYIAPRTDNNNNVPEGERYVIKVGYDGADLTHTFEQGFEGGLLKVERQAQNENIRNIIIGCGSEENLPYRYYKNTDQNSPTFAADPDNIPELANIHFDRLRGATFRSYIQGWKAKHYGGTAPKSKAYAPWAWQRGYTDTKFSPVEAVYNAESIARYGELMGGIDNANKYKPTIQGVRSGEHLTFFGTDIGRVDQIVAVTAISNSSNDSGSGAYIITENLSAATAAVQNIQPMEYRRIGIAPSTTFTVPDGMTANLIDTTPQLADSVMTKAEVYGTPIVNVISTDGKNERIPATGIPAGTWRYEVIVEVHNMTESDTLNLTLTIPKPKVQKAHISGSDADTFEVWIKNIFATSPLTGESDADYAERVWRPLLGTADGTEAKVVFGSGRLSMSEDYEFIIAEGGITHDESKTLTDADGVTTPSHWRIRLHKSNADYDSLGVMVPNVNNQASAGDFFYFIGIELPHPYVIWAEENLDNYKQSVADKSGDIVPTWNVALIPQRIYSKTEYEATAIIDSLEAGAVFTLRDERFISGAHTQTLYIQELTLTCAAAEDGKGAALLPEVNVTLGGEYIATSNPIDFMSAEIENLRGQIGEVSNVAKTVRSVGDSRYLRKDGRADASYSPTDFHETVTMAKDAIIRGMAKAYDGIYTSKDAQIDGKVNVGGDAKIGGTVTATAVTAPSIGNADFAPGLLGHGFRAWMTGDGVARADIDELVVRRKMTVMELVIEEIRATEGVLVVSPGSGEVAQVSEGTLTKDGRYIPCYIMKIKRGGSAAQTLGTGDDARGAMTLMDGDFVRCGRWDFEAGTYRGYWVEVIQVSDDRTTVWTRRIEYGGAAPEAGDELVTMGNRYRTERQGFVVISASETTRPGIRMYDGVGAGVSYDNNGARPTLTGKLRAVYGSLDGVTDPTHGALSGYGLWCDNAYLRGRFALKNTTVGGKDDIADVFSSIVTRVGTLEADVAGHSTAIQQNAAAIALRATKTEVNTAISGVNGEIAKVRTDYAAAITAKANEITSSVNQQITALGNVVSQQGSTIQQTADEIRLAVAHAAITPNLMEPYLGGTMRYPTSYVDVYRVAVAEGDSTKGYKPCPEAVRIHVKTAYRATAYGASNMVWPLSHFAPPGATTDAASRAIQLQQGETVTLAFTHGYSTHADDTAGEFLICITQPDNTRVNTRFTCQTSGTRSYLTFTATQTGAHGVAVMFNTWAIHSLELLDMMLVYGTAPLPYSTDAGRLTETGIDITNRRIVLTADNVVVCNNDGDTTLMLDEEGKLQTNLIRADEIMAQKFVALNDDGTIRASFNIDGDGAHIIYGDDGTRLVRYGYERYQDGNGEWQESIAQCYNTDGTIRWRQLVSGQLVTEFTHTWQALELGQSPEGTPQLYWRPATRIRAYRFKASADITALRQYDGKLFVSNYDGSTPSPSDFRSKLLSPGTYYETDAVGNSYMGYRRGKWTVGSTGTATRTVITYVASGGGTAPASEADTETSND